MDDAAIDQTKKPDMSGFSPAPSTIDASACLTEPLRVSELSNYFEVERHEMRRLLDVIPGAQQVCGLWRLPLQQMPPAYLVTRGLLVPAVVDNFRGSSGTVWGLVLPPQETGRSISTINVACDETREAEVMTVAEQEHAEATTIIKPATIPMTLADLKANEEAIQQADICKKQNDLFDRITVHRKDYQSRRLAMDESATVAERRVKTVKKLLETSLIDASNKKHAVFALDLDHEFQVNRLKNKLRELAPKALVEFVRKLFVMEDAARASIAFGPQEQRTWTKNPDKSQTVTMYVPSNKAKIDRFVGRCKKARREVEDLCATPIGPAEAAAVIARLTTEVGDL